MVLMSRRTLTLANISVRNRDPLNGLILMTESPPYSVEERRGWFYAVGGGKPDYGPFRYRWEAQEYADELNGREQSPPVK